MSNEDFYKVNRALQKFYGLSNGQDEIFNAESTILNGFNPCPLSELEVIYHNIYTLNTANLHNLLSHEFYNPQVQEAASCMLNATYFTSPYGYSFTPHERERMHLSKFKNIGGEDNKVYTVKYDDSKITFLYKESPEFYKNDMDIIVHEAFVGLYCMNVLRKYVPNFMYTYGIYKDVVTLGDAKKTIRIPDAVQVDHLLAEYLGDTNIAKFILTCTPEQFINILMQVMYALEFAQQEFQFTHYDLHTGNVMVSSKFDGQIKDILYLRSNGNKRYVSTTHVATIIDYGDAHVLYQGKHYGILSKKFVNIDNKMSQFNDIYKLLLNLANLMYSKSFVNPHKDALQHLLQQVIKVFNPNDSIASILKEQGKFYYNFYGPDVMTFAQFIDVVEKLWQVDYTMQKNALYNLHSVSKPEIDRELNIHVSHLVPVIDDPYYLYDYYFDALRNQRVKEAQQVLKISLPSQQLFKNSKAKIIHIVDEISNSIDKLSKLLPPPKLDDNLPLDDFHGKLYEQYANVVSIYLKNISKIANYTFSKKVLSFYAQEKSKVFITELIRNVEILDQSIDNLHAFLLLKCKTSIRELVRYLNINEEEINLLIR
jgi:uncharacterized protein YvpB